MVHYSPGEMTNPTASLYPTLAALFPGNSIHEFLRTWPNAPYHCRGPRARLPMAHVPELLDVDSLLTWAQEVPLATFAAALPRARDESEMALGLRAMTARAAFESGMTISTPGLGPLESVFPVGQRFVRPLHRELGLPPSATTRSIIYCSPAGRGTSLHFDRNTNIVVQLAGTKRWTLAPNYEVAYPTKRYSTKQSAPPHPYLQDYLDQPLPTELSAASAAEAIEVALEPGDVLVVPYGWWHQTEAVTDSLQMNFTAAMVSYADIVTKALRRQLERRASWRAYAEDLYSPAAPAREAGLAKLCALLDELSDIVAEMTPEQVPDDAAFWHRAANERPDPQFAVPAGISLRFEAGALEVVGDDIELTLELKGSLAALGAWLSGLSGGFSLSEVQDALSTTSPTNLRRCLSLLSRHGAIEQLP